MIFNIIPSSGKKSLFGMFLSAFKPVFFSNYLVLLSSYFKTGYHFRKNRNRSDAAGTPARNPNLTDVENDFFRSERRSHDAHPSLRPASNDAMLLLWERGFSLPKGRSFSYGQTDPPGSGVPPPSWKRTF